jgi:hypothetical protein
MSEKSYKIDLGKVDYNSTGRKTHPAEIELRIREKEHCAPYLDVELQPLPGKMHREFSFTYDVWQPTRHDVVACGAGVPSFVEEFFGNDPKLKRIAALAERWHLNGLKAGTRAQDEVIEAHKSAHPGWRYDYTEACEILKAAGIYEDRGYKYGSAWLAETAPSEIEAEIRELFHAEE